MSNRIPVTVITGFLGSGKTTLLNRVLAPEHVDPKEASRIALLVNEVGAIGIDHERVRHISDSVVLLESGCVCCSVRGDLVEALRELFMSALHKKTPPFSRVIIETTGLADPAAVMHTLKYESFLRDRYEYAGCIAVLDCVHVQQQLRDYAQARQQLVQADVVVLGKVDLINAHTKSSVLELVGQLNGQAQVFEQGALPDLEVLLNAATVAASVSRAGREGLFSASSSQDGSALQSVWVPGRFVHAPVQVTSFPVLHDVSRAAFSRAIGRIHDLPDFKLLRLKGFLRFQGDDGLSAIHGVHRQLYPIERLPQLPGQEEQRAALVFIAEDGGGDQASLLAGILNAEGIKTGESL